MKLFSRRDVMLALLGLTAAAGVAAAGVSLYRALAAARVLGSVGKVGTKALGGMQAEGRESLQTVLQGLAEETSAGRRARRAEARRVGTRLSTHIPQLVDL